MVPEGLTENLGCLWPASGNHKNVTGSALSDLQGIQCKLGSRAFFFFNFELIEALCQAYVKKQQKKNSWYAWFIAPESSEVLANPVPHDSAIYY